MVLLNVNTIVADATPPALTALSATAASATGWSGSVSTDESDGVLYYLVATQADRSVAQVKAGGSQNVTQTGPQSLFGAGLSPETSYYLHVVQTDSSGNDSAVATSAAFTTDAATAPGPGPTLPSAGAAQAIGASQAIAMLPTTGTDGAVHLVVTGSATPPTATQIIAGQDHTGAAQPIGQHMSTPVARAGLQILAPGPSGLSPNTAYHAHAVHRSQAGVTSSVEYLGSFTTFATNGVGALSLSINKRSFRQIAPEGIFFRADATVSGISNPSNRGVYDPSRHQIHYVWDFGDPGAKSDKVRNVPLAHNDLNLAYGKEVCHVFTAPGSYNVRCTAYRISDGAQIGSSTLPVVVGDPDALFSGTRTITIDPGNTGLAGSYPGSRSAANLPAALALTTGGTPHRIVVADGVNQTINTQLSITNSYSNIYIQAENGGGAKPIFRFPSSVALRVLGSFGSRDLVVDGVRFIGGWNPVSESGSRHQVLQAEQEDQRYMMFTDCETENFGDKHFWLRNVANGTGDPTALIVHNTSVTGWGDYGMFLGPNVDQFIGLIGTAVYQPSQAGGGGDQNKAGIANQHGPVRMAAGGRCYVGVCDMFSNNGWSRETTPRGLEPADQECLRWMSSPEAHQSRRSQGNIERCAFEGGRHILALTDQNGTGTFYGTNLVVEKCLFVGTASTSAAIKVQYTGVTIRNIIFANPNGRKVSNQPFWAIFRNEWNSNGSGNQDPNDPWRAYGISTYNEITDTQRAGRTLLNEAGLGASANNFDIDNFYHWCPNASGQGTTPNPDVSGAPMPTVGGIWTARYVRRFAPKNNWGPSVASDTSFASPPNFVRDFYPNPGSPLIDGVANGDDVAFDDFYGQLRGNAPDRGAVQSWGAA